MADVPTDDPVADVPTDDPVHVADVTTDDPVDVTTDNQQMSHVVASRGPSKRKSTSHAQSSAKRSKNSADDEIDVNRCCVYGDDAGTGREWLQCQCSRCNSIHEDCIDDDNVDVEQCIFCPLC